VKKFPKCAEFLKLRPKNAGGRAGNKHASKKVGKSMDKRIQRREAEIEDTEVPKLSEEELSSLVAAGGGRYVGVLKEIPGKMESVVLFISPRTKTTLGLRISRLTAESVREQLAESDAAFVGAVAK
jgi:hypothetical protein